MGTLKELTKNEVLAIVLGNVCLQIMALEFPAYRGKLAGAKIGHPTKNKAITVQYRLYSDSVRVELIFMCKLTKQESGKSWAEITIGNDMAGHPKGYFCGEVVSSTDYNVRRVKELPSNNS